MNCLCPDCKVELVDGVDILCGDCDNHRFDRAKVFVEDLRGFQDRYGKAAGLFRRCATTRGLVETRLSGLADLLEVVDDYLRFGGCGP